MSILSRILARVRSWRYPGSILYWERRYARGGHSGAGSSGRLAAYKADWLNQFVQQNNVQCVIEFGCGDGQQVQLSAYPAYIGLDVAPSAIRRCKDIFAADSTKQFQVYNPWHFDPAYFSADLSLSVEVLFHLTEDDIYHQYMQHLFGGPWRWVVIFAVDALDHIGGNLPHVRPRKFTEDIPEDWILRLREENPHRDISVSDFFVFEKINSL